MLTDNELNLLAQACAGKLPLVDLLPETSDHQESEKDLMLSLSEQLARDGVTMSFFAAGAYDFYQPIAMDYFSGSRPMGWYQLQASPIQTYLDIKKDVESRLARLLAMDQAVVMHAGIASVLSDLLKQLYSLKLATGLHRRKIILPSSIPPSLRHALRTQLRYQSIETVAIDFDKTSGCISREQLEELDSNEILAIVFSYPNFFGVLEDVSAIANWAREKQVETLVVADALALTYVKSPAQLSEQIDYMVSDLQPLGLPLHRKGNAPTLLAGGKNQLAALKNSDVSFALFEQLVTLRTFLTSQSAQLLGQAYLQAHRNLSRLLAGMLEIENISLRFSSSGLNECVIHIDQIELGRALQILTGHNMLAGYPLVDDYPELDGCLLIHCTDQHDEVGIERLVAKMKTVVKNLSTAGCPVKPKFT